MQNDHADWLFDESKQVGVDYSDSSIVADYDNQHKGFRDFEAEAERIASVLDLSSASTVLDIGCGTGWLSICLARKCRHVFAVDASEAMFDTLKKKLEDQGLKNVTPRRSGFLTYKHEGCALDAVVAYIALHHLPDFWMQIALCRLHDLLKPNGKMFLADVVFDFDPRAYRETLDGWLGGMRKLAGAQMADETIVHIRDEFSTWDWVLSGMIERAGFQIDQTLDIAPQVRAYICSRTE